MIAILQERERENCTWLFVELPFHSESICTRGASNRWDKRDNSPYKRRHWGVRRRRICYWCGRWSPRIARGRGDPEARQAALCRTWRRCLRYSRAEWTPCGMWPTMWLVGPVVVEGCSCRQSCGRQSRRRRCLSYRLRIVLFSDFPVAHVLFKTLLLCSLSGGGCVCWLSVWVCQLKLAKEANDMFCVKSILVIWARFNEK